MGIFSQLFGPIGAFFGWLFTPITFLFHYVFFQPVFNILMLIFQGVHSFGLSIILLTLLIRGSLYPLTRRQIASSRKMQALAPKVNALKAQYRGDQQGQMAATQALYKEHGVSMYGGCLPLLIQMPFLYALYYSFYQVLATKGNVVKAINDLLYPFLPHLTAVPNSNFLGFSLITPSIWLAALAGALTFVQMRMSMPVTPPGATPDTTQQTTKTMQYIMPFFTFYIGTRFPAGLALYWAISTGFSAVQQYFIMGWGSLWVGVPGMERYVPKPAPVTATAVVPTPVPGGPPVGGGGFVARMAARYRELQAMASEQAAARQATNNPSSVVDSTLAESDDADGARAGEVVAPSGQKNTGGASRRQRGARAGGATLIRPASAESDVAPEVRIAQENNDQQPQADELPEKRLARENAMAVSQPNGVKNVGGNGAGRQGGKSGYTKPSGQSGARGRQQSGSRNRSRGSR